MQSIWSAVFLGLGQMKISPKGNVLYLFVLFFVFFSLIVFYNDYSSDFLCHVL